MARAALTSDVRKKGVGPEWHSLPPGVSSKEEARTGGPRGLKGEVAGSMRKSEVSRVDHVTVDNAVLDAPMRSPRSPRGVLGKSKLESRRQPRSTWSTPTSSEGGRASCELARRVVPPGRFSSEILLGETNPPGAERPAGARFRESVAGFEVTHRHEARYAILHGSAAHASGSADVASMSRQDSESPPSDEVRGREGSITPTPNASHSRFKGVSPCVSRKRSAEAFRTRTLQWRPSNPGASVREWHGP